VSYTVLRQREKTGLFALVGAAEAVLLAGGVAVFLLRGEGLEGVMKGYALSAAVVAVGVTVALLARVERRVQAQLVGPMLAFGLPLILSGAAGRFLNLGDRYLLLYFLGDVATAPYEWAARFGGVVNTFLVQSFMLAFTVLGLKAADESGSFELHRRAFRHVAALAGWVVLGLALFVSDVSRLLTDVPAYIDTEGLVLLTAGGFAFYGLYYVVVNVLYVAGRTRAVAASVGGAALLNLVLNLILIPTIGVAGAAVATLVSYAALAVITARTAQSSAAVAYPWRALAAVVVLVGGLWALAVPTADWSPAARLSARVALALAYLPGLLLLGVYGRADLARARDLLRRREHTGSTSDEDAGAR
jgi:O-antigen/teichoic acid export membrane protein